MHDSQMILYQKGLGEAGVVAGVVLQQAEVVAEVAVAGAGAEVAAEIDMAALR